MPYEARADLRIADASVARISVADISAVRNVRRWNICSFLFGAALFHTMAPCPFWRSWSGLVLRFDGALGWPLSAFLLAVCPSGVFSQPPPNPSAPLPLPGRWKPDVVRPGIAWMRRSNAIMILAVHSMSRPSYPHAETAFS